MFESQFIPRFAHLFCAGGFRSSSFCSCPGKDSFSSVPCMQLCLWCPQGAMHLLQSQVCRFFPQIFTSKLGCMGRASHSLTLNSQAWGPGEFCFIGWYCSCYKKKKSHIKDELETCCMFPLQKTEIPENWGGGWKSNVIRKRQQDSICLYSLTFPHLKSVTPTPK